MPNLTPEQARFKDWLQHPLYSAIRFIGILVAKKWI